MINASELNQLKIVGKSLGLDAISIAQGKYWLVDSEFFTRNNGEDENPIPRDFNDAMKMLSTLHQIHAAVMGIPSASPEVQQLFQLHELRKLAKISRVRVEPAEGGFLFFDHENYCLGEGHIWSFENGKEQLQTLKVLTLTGRDWVEDEEEQEFIDMITDVEIIKAA